jgi:arginine repressor
MGKQPLIEGKIGIALGMHSSGVSQCAIANELGVNQSTVSRLFGNVSIIAFKTRSPRRVYKHPVTNRESRRITRLALKLRRITIQDLINELGYNISKKTVARILRENGIRKRVACTKPHLIQSHMFARFEWAKQNETWTVTQWTKVIWSDESIGFHRLGKS